MNGTNICHKRKGEPRLSLEICRWHVYGDKRRKPDRACKDCEVAKQLLKEGGDGSKSESNGK